MSGGSDVDWGKVGTVAGAGVGFALGGPMGAAVGMGLGGGLGGVLNSPKEVGYAGPSAAENELAVRLNRQATGGEMSAAQAQMQQGLDTSNKNAMALAASQRGINPGLAAALATQQQGLNQMETQAQTGLMRAQESAMANQALAGMYASQRGSQLQAAGMNAQLGQQKDGQMLNMLSSAGNAALAYGLMNKPEKTPTPNGSGGAQKLEPGNYSNGGMVPGKPVFGGDHPKNDTVPAMLSPGEIVVPRSVVQMGPEAISKFAVAIAGRGVSNGKA